MGDGGPKGMRGEQGVRGNGIVGGRERAAIGALCRCDYDCVRLSQNGSSHAAEGGVCLCIDDGEGCD